MQFGKLPLIFAILFVASSGASAAVNAKVANKGTAKSIFSSEVFDASIDKLPAKYVGHDFYVIYKTIEKIPPKSEFESTEAHQQRLVSVATKPLSGALTLDSSFAFSIRDVEATYDADSKTLSVSYSGKDNFDSVDFELFSHYKKTGTYTASNAFNHKVSVQKGVQLGYYVTFKNCTRQYHDKYLGERTSSLSTSTFSAKIEMEPDRAKQAKQALAILVVGKMNPPFVEVESFVTQPKIDFPYETYVTKRKFLMDVSSMWIYNTATGEIYRKIGKCSIPSDGSFIEMQHYLF